MKLLKYLCCGLILLCNMALGQYQESTTPKEQKKSNNSQTLIKPGTSVGGYGALATKVNWYHGNATLASGLQAGVILDHTFSIGIAGYGLLTNNKIAKDTTTLYMYGGYGGLYMEYVLFSDKVVHISFPLLVGVGGLELANQNILDPDRSYYDWEDIHEEAAAYFVAEPGINIELNVARFFRVSGGISYHFVAGTDHLIHTSDKALSGWGSSLSLRFGSF